MALKTRSSYAIPGFLYMISPSGSNFSKIIESLGLDAVWNKDGSGIIYNNSDLDLFYLDIKAGINKSLGIKSVAEKCAFGKTQSNVVYCAIPKNINEANYPDEWWQGKISFEDNIVSVDTTNLDLILYAKTQSDIVNPVLLENDSYMLFKDRNTGELWSLKLK